MKRTNLMLMLSALVSIAIFGFQNCSPTQAPQSKALSQGGTGGGGIDGKVYNNFDARCDGDPGKIRDQIVVYKNEHRAVQKIADCEPVPSTPEVAVSEQFWTDAEHGSWRPTLESKQLSYSFMGAELLLSVNGIALEKPKLLEIPSGQTIDFTWSMGDPNVTYQFTNTCGSNSLSSVNGRMTGHVTVLLPAGRSCYVTFSNSTNAVAEVKISVK